MKRALKIILKTLLVLAGFIAAAFIVFNAYDRISHRDFYAAAQKKFRVPGVCDGLVQQGMFRADDGNVLVCGYMRSGDASRIYLLDPDGGVLNYVELRRDGKPDAAHAGGICCYRGMVFVTVDDGLGVFSYDDVKNSPKGSGVEPMNRLELGLPASYCYIGDGRLFVGEYFCAENYPTDPSHHLSTPAGDNHHAIMLSYDVDDVVSSMQRGAEPTPTAVYSVPDLAQGAACFDGTICITTSRGVSESHMRFYPDLSTAGEGRYEFAFGGKTLPLYYLDSYSCEKDVTLFPMAEEIFEHDGRIYIINESASTKYIFGILTGGRYVYSYEY